MYYNQESVVHRQDEDQGRSKDIQGPWTTDSPGPLPILHNLFPDPSSTYIPTQTLHMFISIIWF